MTALYQTKPSKKKLEQEKDFSVILYKFKSNCFLTQKELQYLKDFLSLEMELRKKRIPSFRARIRFMSQSNLFEYVFHEVINEMGIDPFSNPFS